MVCRTMRLMTMTILQDKVRMTPIQPYLSTTLQSIVGTLTQR